MSKVLLFNFLFISVFCIQITNQKPPQFYEYAIDNIEDLSDDQFKENVLNSYKVTYLEFYANWCSFSRKFIPRWKQFANETKLWHKKVLRVAAIDCYYRSPNEICAINNITEAPQMKFVKFLLSFNNNFITFL